MNLFKAFLKEMTGFDDPKSQAKAFLDQVTLSSRLGHQPSKAVIDYLAKTRNSGTYRLYRGLSLGSLSSSDKKLYSSLKAGDQVPETLAKPNSKQTVIHTTSSKAVAKRYASGGSMSLVYEIEINPGLVLFDSNNIKKCFSESDFDEDDWSYFKAEKEVMLFQDAEYKATVLEIKIK